MALNSYMSLEGALLLAIVLVAGVPGAVLIGRKVKLTPTEAVALYAIHLAYTFASVAYVTAYGGDSIAYYHMGTSGDFSRAGGTRHVAMLVHAVHVDGASTFLSTTLIFSYAGLIAAMLLVASIRSGFKNHVTSRQAVLWSYAVFLLPGFHFWTSAIGKDALTAAGIYFVIYRLIVFRSVGLSGAVAIMGVAMVRPHMAFLLVACMAVAAIGTSFRAFVGAAAVLIAVLPFSALFLERIGVTTLDEGAITQLEERIDRIEEANQIGGGQVSVEGGLATRVATYLFRPLFFDATTPMAYVASLENTLWLALCTLLLLSWRVCGRVLTQDYAARFCGLYFVAALFTLSLGLSNLGIALRQKQMFVPILLIVAAQIALHKWDYNRRRRLGVSKPIAHEKVVS